MTRLVQSQRLGLDRFAISDATNFVEQSGWANTSSPYAMYIAAITYLRRNEKDHASEVLAAIRSHVLETSWQGDLVSFFEGKMTAQALMTKAASRLLCIARVCRACARCARVPIWYVVNDS